MMPTCLVLAGGLGTRMGHFTENMPKILIPVNGRPFLHHQLNLLRKQGFTRVVLSLGYRGQMVVDELRASPHYGIDVEIIVDGPEPLGTGGAVRQACEDLIMEDVFFVTYGDSYLMIDPQQVIEAFDDTRFDALMTLYKNDDNLDVSNAQLHQYDCALYQKNHPDPKSAGYDMVDFGLSLITRRSVLEMANMGETWDLADYFEVISAQYRLQGLVTQQRFYEIGSYTGRDTLEKYLFHREDGHDQH